MMMMEMDIVQDAITNFQDNKNQHIKEINNENTIKINTIKILETIP